MPAPTLAKPQTPQTQTSQGNGTPAAGNANAAPALIPFTRAARKKSRLVTTIGPTTLTASQQQVNPIQIPANGYIRKLILDIVGTTASNAANVAFQPDAPFNILQQLSLTAANGDSLINPISGFTLAMLTKYGCFNGSTKDPLRDPKFKATTGAGGTGGSFQVQLEVPFEIDARDALCALPNMAANQSFLLQFFLNNIAGVYSTAPTNPAQVTITVTVEYWAAPAATNGQGVPQQTAPRVANAVSLLQTQTPPIVPSSDQVIGPLVNVGNTIRFLYFELRTAAGVRTDADWPNVFNFIVNNDLWYYKTKDNWQRQMAIDYNLTGGPAASPTVNQLDQGVYVLTDFMNDGGSGGELADSSQMRDLMLVTGSGTAINVEAQNWGAAASQLLIVTNALRIPDPSSFYAPIVV